MAEPEKILSFEEALSQLEQVVSAMESGKLPLDQLISSFERGNVLVRQCRNRLKQLEQRIELLSRDDGKTGEWTEFTPENFRAADSGTKSADDGMF